MRNWGFSLFFLVAQNSAWAVHTTNFCAHLMDSVVSNEISSLESKLNSQETAIQNLIHNYAQTLGIFQDPFVMAHSPDQGERIFARLSLRIKNGKWVKSPLAIMNRTLKRAYSSEKKYNEKLIHWIIDDITKSLESGELDRTDLQSNLLALKYAHEYLRRYKEPEAPSKGDNVSAKPAQKEQKNDKNETQKSEDETPPEYPELPKEYKPFTKDTQNKGGGKQTQHRVAEVNFTTPFFAQRYFAEILRGAPHPFREAILPSAPLQPSRYEQTSREQIVKPFGKKIVDLFIPPLFKPLQPSDPRAIISRLETGGYTLELKEDLFEIKIPLVEESNISMMPHVQDVYTREIGFKSNEWPENIQVELIRKFTPSDAKQNPLRVAQGISDYISSQYLYSVGPKPETDPIDALKAGAFQCDMAAYAMIGLLRDIYHVPSRVVGGFRAKKHQTGSDGKSYLIIPGEAHTWVEVFHNGSWNLFDPTPVKKDKKDKQTGPSDEYSDNPLENTKPAQDGSETENSRNAQPPQPGSVQKQDHQERLENNSNNRSESLLQRFKRLVGMGEKTEKPVDDEKTPKEEGLTSEELAKRLELGSLELKPTIERNVLLERVMRVLLQMALNPTQKGSEIQNRLNQISSLLGRFNSPALKSLYQRALSAHSSEHADLKDWVDQLFRTMTDRDLNEIYKELHQLITAIEVFDETLDSDGKISRPGEVLKILKNVKQQIGVLAHPDSQDIGLVHDFVSTLPTVPRILLKNDFDLSEVGPNSPTRSIAHQLKSGKLNDLRLLSILSPISDFILNSTPAPEMMEVKTWQKDLVRPRGTDLLPVQRVSELNRAILGQPGKSVEENMEAGTAYVSVRRKRVKIPTGYGQEEAERITILLYDTSGSMDGDPGRFQAGLISAFTGKALSDVSPSGRHRHRVLIVPFDGSPGTPIRVTDTMEALEIIRNYQEKLKNTQGSTDIQKALLQAMSLIADAERRAGEPLAAANIILMTDGQSKIDADELLNARKAIDRKTPLQTMFIAINQTNEELIRFAMDSKSMGSERGFYREFTPDHIKDILRESSTLNLSDRDDFYTEKSSAALPSEVYLMMNQALKLSIEFSDQIYYGTQPVSLREHLKRLEKLKWNDVGQIDRPLEKWIVKVRQLVKHPIFKDKKILESVVNDLLINIERLSGVETNAMSDYEQEQLKHLVRFAAGLEEGVW